MKRKRIVKILCIILAVGLFSLSAGLVMGGKTAAYWNEQGFTFYAPLMGAGVNDNHVDSVVVDITEPVTDIQIRLKYGDIIVNEGEKFQIEYHNIEAPHRIDDGTLLIEPSKDASKHLYYGSFSTVDLFGLGSIMYSRNIPKLTVTIPKDSSFDSLSIFASSGDIIVSDGIFDAFTLDSDYGDIILDNITSSQIQVTINSGNFNCDTLILDTMEIENDYGSVILNDISHHTLILHSNSGDTILTDVTGENLTIDSDYGHITLSDITQDKIIINSSSGDTILSNPKIGSSLDIEQDYGDVIMTLPDADSQIITSTDYGDATLNGVSFVAHIPDGNNLPKLTIHTASGNINISTT